MHRLREFRLSAPGLLWAALACPWGLFPQEQARLAEILERLDRLARENLELRAELRALKEEVQALRLRSEGPAAAPSSAPIEERLEIHERRIAEQAQSKVEASQRLPIRVSGMALFNAFLNSSGSGGRDNPVQAALEPGPRTGGATFRQSLLGLEFQGPGTLWGGKVRGNLFMDFYAGSSSVLNHLFRIRTATVELGWRNRSIVAGLEKPIFNPREPTSLAQVGFSPLTGSGNLWVWQPQARFEQRFRLGEGTRVEARLGIAQASDELQRAAAEYGQGSALRRPAFQGRFLFAHQFGEGRRLEIAPGFHFSRSRLGGVFIPSRLASLDWLISPVSRLQFTGFFFSGRNVGMFGAPGQGVVRLSPDLFLAVHSRGGWGQLSVFPTQRLSFNVYGGQHDDRNSDLLAGQIGVNRSYAANLIYRLAPNVLVGVEALQLRTRYIGTAGTRINNRYDLALAYLF